MSEEDHIDLLNSLLYYKDNSKFMLSGYDNDIYNNFLTGWNKHCFEVGLHAAKAVKGKNNQRRTECIWMNY